MGSLSTLSKPDATLRQPLPEILAPRNERIGQALLAASAAWLLIGSFLIWRHTFDDSYIFFRFAEQLARGLGPVFNAGERVEGYTSFLLVLSLAGAVKLGLNVILASKILGLLLSLSVLVAAYFLCRLLSTSKAPVYGAALLLTASNTHFIVASVAGLETPLFTAVLCWSLFAYLKATRATDLKIQQRWWAGAAILFALLVMSRPDGVVIYAVLWLYAAWKFRRQPRVLAFFTAPFLLVYLPYFCWRWHYYGFLFPNTFYVKRGGTPALLAKGLTETGKFLGLETGGWFLSGLVGLAVILFPATEMTVLALAVASRIFFELWSGGVSAGEFHFLISALPLFWIIAERVLSRAFVALQGKGRALAAGLCMLLVGMQAASFFQFRKTHIKSVDVGMERAHIAVGRWLGAHSPPDATVAVGDIGAIGLWSHRRILDLDGLTDTYISHLPGVYPDRHDSRYVLRQTPEYVVLRTSSCQPESQDVSFGMDKAIYADPQFARDYSWTGCWEFWPRYDLVMYQRK